MQGYISTCRQWLKIMWVEGDSSLHANNCIFFRDFDFPKSKRLCWTLESPTPGAVIFTLCPRKNWVNVQNDMLRYLAGSKGKAAAPLCPCSPHSRKIVIPNPGIRMRNLIKTIPITSIYNTNFSTRLKFIIVESCAPDFCKLQTN